MWIFANVVLSHAGVLITKSCFIVEPLYKDTEDTSKQGHLFRPQVLLLHSFQPLK